MKKLIKHKFKGNEFARNALTLTAGTTIAQILPLLIYPLLGRLYSPDDFGLFATISSITSILVVVATGKYDLSVLIADTKKEAGNVVGLVLMLSSGFLLVTLVLFQLLAQPIGAWLNNESLSRWLFLAPVAAFFIIVYNLYNEWCVRNKYFVNLSANKIVNSVGNSGGKLFFGFKTIPTGGLVLGDTIGRAVAAIVYAVRAWLVDKETFSAVNFITMKEMAVRFVNFPKYHLPGSVINVLGGQIPILLIGILFNETEVGYYGMTVMVLSLPSILISAAIRDVFRQRANEDIIKTGTCTPLYMKTFKYLAAFALLGLLALFILPQLFTLFLGDQWVMAGKYAQILFPMVLLSFISNSLSSVLVIREKQKVILRFQVYYLSVTVVSMLLGYWFSDRIEVMLLLFAIGRGSAYLLETYLSYIYSKRTIA